MGHGPRVIGAAAFAEQQKNQKAGVDKFGPRVRGQGTAQTAPVSRSPVGTRVNSPEPESVSVEELARILGENSTFFESLYENELARTDGARPEALLVFLAVEKTTQQRPDVIQEITELLEAKGISAGTLNNLRDTTEADLNAPIGDPPPPPPGYDAMTKAQLEEAIIELGGDPTTIVGTGADGAILKADLLETVKVLAGQGA